MITNTELIRELEKYPADTSILITELNGFSQMLVQLMGVEYDAIRGVLIPVLDVTPNLDAVEGY